MSKMFVKQDGNLFDILSKDRAFISKLKKVDAGYKNAKGGVSKCWEWQGAVFSNKYGRLGTPVETKGEVIQRTHRYAYYLANGKIKKDLLVLHKCDNRICCNPKHLYQGDHRQNMIDMTARGQSASGERNAKTVFVEPDIEAIRFFSSLGFRLSDIMVMFGSPKSTIHNILTRRVWDHVPDRVMTMKRVERYIATRKSIGAPLAVPNAKMLNIKAIPCVRQVTVKWLRDNVTVFGQERFAQMIGSSRKKIRCALDNDNSEILDLNISSGEISVYEEPRGYDAMQRIVELIQSI